MPTVSATRLYCSRPLAAGLGGDSGAAGLGHSSGGAGSVGGSGGGGGGGGTGGGSLAGTSLEQLEKRAIRETLRLTAGNREKAAQLLGIGERTLYRKLKDYGLR